MDSPAQFTSEEGAGKDLYACHNNEAVFARLLGRHSQRRDHVTSNFSPDLGYVSACNPWDEEDIPNFFDPQIGLLHALTLARTPPPL